MQDPAIVYSSPVKKNITYFVRDKPKEGIPAAFNPIVKGYHRTKWITKLCCIQSSRYVYTQHTSFCQGKDFETVHITRFFTCNNCNSSICYGIDCPDVRQVIHWGVPEDAEMYVQESRRAGRYGKPACALLMKNSRDVSQRYTSKQMIEYCTNESSLCRRSILYRDFPSCEFFSQGCMCCDVCASCCECGQCDKILNSFFI